MLTNRRTSCCLVLLLFFIALPLQAQVDRVNRGRMRDALKTVSNDIQKNFYDPNLKGLDWRALTDEAGLKIDNAKSMSEMIAAIFILTNKLDDSHTQFLPPSRSARPLFGFMAKPFGNEMRIFAVQTNGPAAKAGLKVGDRLLAVGGFAAERRSFDLMMLDFRAIRPRSELIIKYSRGDAPPQTVDLKAQIKQDMRTLDLQTTIWRYLREWEDEAVYHWKVLDDGIGYIEIPTFDVEELTQPHQFDKPPKAIVIDLRNNGGGSQDALLEFAGHFEPAPTTMGNMIQRKKTEPLKIKPQKPNYASVPVVVLIDSETGSAAEMVARHLQVSRNAVVVGDRSSGRVNASQFFISEMGSDTVVPYGVQISVGRLVLANGEELEKRGVVPDVACLPGESDLRDGRDPCLERAVALARKTIGLSESLPVGTQLQVTGLTSAMLSAQQKQYDRVH